MGEFENTAKAVGLSETQTKTIGTRMLSVSAVNALRLRDAQDVYNEALSDIVSDIVSDVVEQVAVGTILALREAPPAPETDDTPMGPHAGDLPVVEEPKPKGKARGPDRKHQRRVTARTLYGKLGSVVGHGSNKTLAVRDGMVEFAFAHATNGKVLTVEDLRTWAVANLGLAPDVANRLAYATTAYLRGKVGFEKARGRKPRGVHHRGARLVAPSKLPAGFANGSVTRIANAYGVY
jgi:hypothetical protein